LPSRFLGPIEEVVHEIEARNAPLRGEQRKARLAAIRASLEESLENMESDAASSK
jgi:hypothetical protein